jgi:hypothetical protein
MCPRGRALWLAGAATVAACTPAPRPTTPVLAVPVASTAPVCRVGADDGPLVAERGIGGTGAPATQIAERGIGGTGIIGVVTGFASICLAGHEVALPPDVPIEIGGAPSNQQALRAGQVAAVEAGGPADALYARRVTVRFEVEGPIESIGPDRLQVAGQTVLLSPDTWLRTAPALGQWVAVSGFRDAAGAIAATRLDLISTRTFIVHGVVQQAEGGYRIGTLPIVPGPGDILVPGLPVSITGIYNDGGVRAASITPDLFASDPVAYFGGYTSTFIVEGFSGADGGRGYYGTLPFSPAPASSRSLGGGRSVVEFQRTGSGGIKVNSVVPSTGTGPHPGFTPSGPSAAGDRFGRSPTGREGRGGDGGGGERNFEPAPTPNRSLGYGSAPDGSNGSNRFGDGGRNAGSRGQNGAGNPGFGNPGGNNGPGPGPDGGNGRRH